MEENIRIIEVVGDAEKRYEFDDGLIFIHREPTAREVINYKNSVAYRRTGKSFKTKSAEQQLDLADKLIMDVRHLGYRDEAGEIKALTKNTRPQDIAHIKIDGMAPKDWKLLIPAARKIQFIENILAGVETSEKNS